MEESIVNGRRPDRRIMKTKKAICNAFASLLAKKPMTEITIKEVAELADVNRKTVYNYYSGVHEIIDDIENRVVEAYDEAIRSIDFKEEFKNPYLLFESLTLILNSNLDFYGSLFCLNNTSNLANKIVKSLKEAVCKVIREQRVLPDDKIEFIVSYVVSGMIAAYQTWFNSDRSTSLEEFSRNMGLLVLNGTNSFRG